MLPVIPEFQEASHGDESGNWSRRTFRIAEGSIIMEGDIPYTTDDYEEKKTDRRMNCRRCLRAAFKLLRSLLGLVVLLLAYTFLGAWIMMSIEAPAENMQRAEVLHERQTCAELLKNNTKDLQARLMNESEWERRTEEALLNFEQTVINTGMSTTSKRKWTFFGAVLFCVTTYTTIGYGNIAPSTKAGRVAAMLYATIGIPLALIVLADLGRRLTAGLKYLWSFLRRYYYTGYCRKVRNRGRGSYNMAGDDSVDGKRQAASSKSQPANGSSHGSDRRHEPSTELRQDVEAGSNSSGGGAAKKQNARRNGDAASATDSHKGGSDGHLEEVVTNGGVDRDKSGEDSTDGVKCSVKIAPLPGRHSQDRDSQRSHNTNTSNSVHHDDSPARSSFGPEPEDDFNLPVSVAIGFIFFYMFFGAFLYTRWEDWTYLESFYFVFITASTIGYGDILPEHPNFFLLTCIYTFFGLALVSMTINVIMEFLSETIDRAKVKVEEAKELAKAKAMEAKGRLSEAGSKAKEKVVKTISKSEGTPSPEEQHRKRGPKKNKKTSIDRSREPSEELQTEAAATESQKTGQ
nr:hypothetical protein BaRGS_031291 [Batillaria attramentaria]